MSHWIVVFAMLHGCNDPEQAEEVVRLKARVHELDERVATLEKRLGEHYEGHELQIRNGAREEMRDQREAEQRVQDRRKSIDGKISELGDGLYSVELSLFEDVDGLGREMRAIPHRGPDSQLDGFRVSGIRLGSTFERLGLRNGDIVHSVGDHELGSMQQAMEAYQALTSEEQDEIVVKITRRGQAKELRYRPMGP